MLGLREGASENAIVVVGLLEELVERGVKPDRRRLFVIDGAKALRKAIDQVYGTDNPIQRCRNHKMRSVVAYLPEASMGSAIEMWEAKKAGAKVIAITGLKHNWVVRYTADLMVENLEQFAQALSGFKQQEQS